MLIYFDVFVKDFLWFYFAAPVYRVRRDREGQALAMLRSTGSSRLPVPCVVYRQAVAF